MPQPGRRVDGDLDIVEESDGRYRWTFNTTGGAQYVGAKSYTTKTAAKKAGLQQWNLTSQ